MEINSANQKLGFMSQLRSTCWMFCSRVWWLEHSFKLNPLYYIICTIIQCFPFKGPAARRGQSLISPVPSQQNPKQYPLCTPAYNWVKLQWKIITYLITWDVGNVVLLHPHISGIFLGNVHLHRFNSISEILSISRLILAFNSSNVWGFVA